MRFYIESIDRDFEVSCEHIRDVQFDGHNIIIEPSKKLLVSGGKLLISVKSGNLTCMVNEKLFMASTSEYGTVELEYGESVRLSLIGDFSTEVSIFEFYNNIVVEDIESEKVSSSDIRFAYRVALTDFRGAKYIFKSLKDCWYDQYLQKAIKKLNDYFISFGVWLLVSLIITVSLQYFSHLDFAFLSLVIWTLVHLFLIRPILYLLFLPKPISKHIKPIIELTSEELAIKKALEEENERTKKLLKKYRITGRNKYID